MKRAVSIGIVLVLFTASAVWANRNVEPLSKDARADLIVVEKQKRALTLYSQGGVLRTYRIALGRSPNGTKEREGDNRTPEGRYVIDSRKADSAYHRALHVSYPSDEDKKRALARGVSPGGDIMIHGARNGLGWLGRSHRMLDWTRGCIAVTNQEIEEIWRVVPDGTPIEIRP